MDVRFFFSMSYGVYIVTSMNGETPVGCTANSAMQITAEPATIAVSINHENLTHKAISESGMFALNVLSEASDPGLIGGFGFRSSRDVDKFAAMHLSALPAAQVGTVLLEQSPVNLECKVTHCIPLGSHDLFLAEVVAVDVDESLLDEMGKLCLNRAKLIVYSHGDYLALGRRLGRFGYSVRKKPRRNK